MSRVNHKLALEFPVEELRKYVYYDGITGDLLWRADCPYIAPKINNRRKHTPVGTVQQRGYRTVGISFNGRKLCLMACRMTWAVVYGEWPNGNIFFRDGNKANVKIDNMVHVSPRVNHIVGRLRNIQKSQEIGIRQAKSNSWTAYTLSKQKTFDSFEEAIEWRNSMIEERINELLPF